uniref:Vezatin n=1 Tax=Anopheles maculatus TaxID=74869 RepID=A0A182SLN7_9DIPT
MFVDHLELAELSVKLNTCSNPAPEPVLTYRTIGAGCILTMAAAARCWFSQGTNRWQMVASTTGAVLFGAMAYERYCCHDNLRQITKILATLESYDNAMKKMLLCINEMFYGNDRIGFILGRKTQKDTLLGCIENSTKAIYELYGYIKALEAKITLHDEFAKIYDPVESLNECDVFQQAVLKQSTTKQLYNIFLYMQSHCVMLLTLAVASDMKLSEVKVETNRTTESIDWLTKQLKKQFALITSFQVDSSNYTRNQSQTIPKDLLSVKQQSLELAAKLSVNIQHVVRLDQAIQSIENTESWDERLMLEETVNNLANFHSYFKTRLDECDRLIICVKKLLYTTTTHASNEGEQSAPLEFAQEDLFEKLLLDQQEAQAPQDEFFLNTGTETDEENGNDCNAAMNNLQQEDEQVDKRLMKNRFKPVLAQLRERLAPVEQSFKERERVALQLKGIALPEEAESRNDEPVSFVFETDDEIESTEAEMAVKNEYRRSQNKYKDDRDFLASKSQYSLFAGPPSMVVEMEETILE